ncbi:alpha/beta hydrolase [Lacibacterium aquatile]|uniref:Alpha/beta hydrolase n=1 Tax=Lacibacterium aquatile TaxID=1168082 RepID=A0ABW5DQ13_9PROT
MSRPIIVALHGVGASSEGLAAALQPLEAQAEVIALPGPEAFDRGGPGRQWFSIAGVTEENRPARVAAALPPLLTRLQDIADQRGIPRHDLILLGFSQGAIMTLAAVAGGHHPGRAIAIAGRLAASVAAVDEKAASVILVHDRGDAVMPVSLSKEASAALERAGHRVTIQETVGLGHSIGAETITIVRHWLEQN